MARPSIYTEDLALEICSLIADGFSIRSICLREGMPDKSNVFRWLTTIKEFRDQYELATEARADALVEEMLDIADDGTNDWMEQKDASGATIGYKINGEHVQRSRLRLDARKWIASKLKAKKYGEKIETTVKGDAENPIVTSIKIEHITPDGTSS